MLYTYYTWAHASYKLLGNFMIIVHSLLNPTSTSQKQAFMHVRLEFVWKCSLHVNCTTKQPMSLCCVRIAGQGQRWRWRWSCGQLNACVRYHTPVYHGITQADGRADRQTDRETPRSLPNPQELLIVMVVWRQRSHVFVVYYYVQFPVYLV